MVKRKAAAKKTAAKKAKPGTIADRKVKNGAPRSMKTARPARKPRTGEQLELIKGVRYAELDRLCRLIGDDLESIAELNGTIAGHKRAAMKAMRLRTVKGYKYAGVLLSIVPGDEKLSVKRDKDKTGDGGGEPEPVPARDEVGTGQEPGAIAESLTAGDEDEPER